jgi:MFS family permease
LIQSFELNLTLVSLLPFSFFIAYGVTSIPAGILLETYREKKVMLVAFGMATIGSLLMVLSPNYLSALLSLFLIGSGMAMLQVVINPLLRTAGGSINLWLRVFLKSDGLPKLHRKSTHSSPNFSLALALLPIHRNQPFDDADQLLD